VSAAAALAVPGDGSRRTFFLRRRATFIGGDGRGPPAAARGASRAGAPPRQRSCTPHRRVGAHPPLGDRRRVGVGANRGDGDRRRRRRRHPQPPTAALFGRLPPRGGFSRRRTPPLAALRRHGPPSSVASAVKALDSRGGSAPAVGRAVNRLPSGDWNGKEAPPPLGWVSEARPGEGVEEPLVGARRGADRRWVCEGGASGRPGVGGRG